MDSQTGLSRNAVETLWAGEFGTHYTNRNSATMADRLGFWSRLVMKYEDANSFLEVGCNIGHNLLALRQAGLRYQSIWGCDVNVEALKCNHVKPNVMTASGYDLPLKDGFVDLVFTCGVLIHQGPSNYMGIVDEMFRVAKKYVLIMEYDWPVWQEIPYRDQPGALWKGPFIEEISEKYGARPVNGGFLTKEDGFDRVTWALFRSAPPSSRAASTLSP